MQRRRQRKAAEKHIDNRIGKARQRGLGVHIGDFEQNGKQRYDQRGHGNVYRFGEPHNRHEGQNGQPLIDIAVVGQDLVEHRTDKRGNDGDHQPAKIGYRRLRAQ